MTRKRFVKLLMAYGYSRNEAQTKAEIVNRRKKPFNNYKNAFKFYEFSHRLAYTAKRINIARLGAFALAVKKRGDAEK